MKSKFKAVAIVTAIAICLSVALGGCGYSRIKVEDSHYARADADLINPDATENAKELMRYLKSVYGTGVISGQYVNEYENFDAPEFRVDENDPQSPRTVFKANELQAVYKVTGEYPALIGLDVSGIECGEKCYSTEQAVEWHNAGGIVTLCWHWKIDNFDGKPREFYTEKTDFNLRKTLRNKDSEQYKGLIKDIDVVSAELKKLYEADVPVLWRPLHEAGGGWFWWGASGKNAYKELWDILYDRMVNYHGLDNLIWVYNGQEPDWYVGDDKCDIIGDDPYYLNNERERYLKDTANSERFKKTYAASSAKMIMMSENDFVFDIDSAFRQNTRWLTFCTWCREFVCVYEQGKDGNYYTKPEYGAMCSTEDELKSAYHNARTITLSDLVSSGQYNPVRG